MILEYHLNSFKQKTDYVRSSISILARPGKISLDLPG